MSYIYLYKPMMKLSRFSMKQFNPQTSTTETKFQTSTTKWKQQTKLFPIKCLTTRQIRSLTTEKQLEHDDPFFSEFSIYDLKKYMVDNKNWIKSLMKVYKTLPFHLIRSGMTVIGKQIKPEKKEKNKCKKEKKEEEKNKCKKEKKEEEKNKCKKEEKKERVMKFGFVYQLSVPMWFGYKDALCEYIDAHNQEWINRGYKNTMPFFNIKAKEYPSWTQDIDYHTNFKSALLNKELTREEKPWYVTKPEFKNIPPFTKYLWLQK